MFRVFALILLLLTGTALAHGPEKGPDLRWRSPVLSFDPGAPPKSNAVKLDLAVDGQTIKLFVTDVYGNPVDIDIAEAKVFISSAGKTSWFSMRPASMNMLSGEGDFVRDADMRVDVTLRLPGQKPITKVFWPLR